MVDQTVGDVASPECCNGERMCEAARRDRERGGADNKMLTNGHARMGKEVEPGDQGGSKDITRKTVANGEPKGCYAREKLMVEAREGSRVANRDHLEF